MKTLQQPLPPNSTATAARGAVGARTLLGVLLAAAALVFILVSLRPVTHSETRYVEAGAEMLATGDWVVPHLAHVAYFEKPILTYWAEAAAQSLFGTSDVAVRLPSILACLGMIVATWGLARTLRGDRFAVGAAALLAGGVYFQGMGSVMTTDPLFAAWLALAWYAFRRHDLDPSSRWIWVFWAAGGLAILTKGPLGGALLAVSIAGYLALAGRIRDLLRMRLVRGLALVVAILLPWAVLVWMRDPRYLQFFFIRENLQAFTTGEVNHPGKPWYYLPFLAGAFFPSALVAAWAMTAACSRDLASAARGLLRRRLDAVDSGRLYACCVLVLPLLLLSVAGSKLGTYLLPLMPAAAIVTASWIADRLEDPPFILRWGSLLQWGLVLCATPFAVWALHAHPEIEEDVRENAASLVAALLVLGVGGIAGAVLAARRRIVLGMGLASIAAVAGVVAALPAIEDFSSETDAAQLMPAFVAERRPGEKVVLAGQVTEDYSIVRALGERTYIWGPAREIGMGHFTEVTSPDVPIPYSRDAGAYDVGTPRLPLPENPWLLDDDELTAVWRGPARVWLVGRASSDLAKLRHLGLPVHVFAKNDARAIVTNQPLAAPLR